MRIIANTGLGRPCDEPQDDADDETWDDDGLAGGVSLLGSSAVPKKPLLSPADEAPAASASVSSGLKEADAEGSDAVGIPKASWEAMRGGKGLM